VYVGGPAGMYRSIDNGAHWQSINSGLADSVAWDIVVSSMGEIVVSTQSRGVFRSTDHGDSWQPFTMGLSSSYIYAMANDSSGGVLAATNSGLIRSTDDGIDWEPIGMADTEISSVVVSSDGTIFASHSIYSPTIYHSTDLGVHWSVTPYSSDTLAFNDIVHVLAVSPHGYLFAGTSRGTLRTSDKGFTWATLPSTEFITLAVAPNGDVFGTAGPFEGGLYRSTDDGNTWTELDTTNPYPYWDINAIAFNANNEMFLNSDDTSEEIFKSTYDGNVWTESNQGLLPNTSIGSIAINRNGSICLGTDSGFYLSTNDGISWYLNNDGLMDKTIQCLDITTNGTILAATSRGIFRTQPSSASVSTKPIENQNIPLSNSPNPVQHSTFIRFYLSQRSFVTLTLFDATGREVGTLASEFMDAGEHEVPFQRGTLPSGVYFYRLESGVRSTARAMVVVP
jgi:photosystem II stability/assembly factor-like uncharacterized protein